MMKKLVRENMSSHLVTIGWHERMDTAYQRMKDKHVRHLPVMNETGEVIGMLSDRDIQRAMVSSVEHETMSQGVSETIVFDPNTRVRDYMNWPVLTVDQNTDLRQVAIRMIQEKVSAFLVYKHEKVVGIVTTEDLLKVLADLLSDPKLGPQWTLDHILENAFNQLGQSHV